ASIAHDDVAAMLMINGPAAAMSSRRTERDAQTRPIELAGASGYHRRWDDGRLRDDVVVVNRDRTLYAVHVRGRGGDLFEHSVASFEFVD
ncbi:MAG: hypothetical protein R6X02_13020, partial [Enhygromyxa sp.]